MKKILIVILLGLFATIGLHGQQRQTTARVNGIEVTYLSPKDGAQLKYRTDSTDQGTLRQGDQIVIIDYSKSTYTTQGKTTARIPKMAKPRSSDQTIDMLGWKCRVKKQGQYCVYYTTEPGFAATPAPNIAAPKDGAVLLVTDLKSGDVIYTATVISQIH